jgi:hypothetical protein
MRKIGSTVVVLAACLALAACWMSKDLLLDQGRGSNALRPGIYQTDNPDKMRVESRGRGWYIISDGGETREKAMESALPMFVQHLPGAAPDVYAFAAGPDKKCDKTQAASCEGWTYGVMKITPDAVMVGLPDCGKTGDLFKQYGGAKQGTSSDCVFTDRKALFAALSAYAGQAGVFEHPYKRIG